MTIASRCGRCNVRNALTIALAAALQLSASGALAQNATQASTTSWAPTNTPIPAASQCGFSGELQPQGIAITVSLKLQNKELLDQYIHDVYTPGNPLYHEFLSEKDATAFFAPTQQQAQSVADYLTKQGMTNVVIAPNRMLVTAYATTAQAALAFNTAVAFCTASNGLTNGLANTQSVQVPAELLTIIDQVLGLQTFNRMHTLQTTSSIKNDSFIDFLNGGISPTGLAQAYDASSLPPASNTEVAIIGWGDMTKPIGALAAMENALNIPAVQTEVKVYGNPNSTTDGGSDGGEIEFQMDAQAIVGMSGGVKKLTFYSAYTNIVDFINTDIYNVYMNNIFAPGTSTPTDDWASLIPAFMGGSPDNGAILQAINGAVSDNTAQVINMSFGAGECPSISHGPGGNFGFADNVFELGVVQGQTFVAATGDNGAYPCFDTPDEQPLGPFIGSGVFNGTVYGSHNYPAAGYPASSPYVVAVGGTTLKTRVSLWPLQGDKYVSETAWSHGGGGVSNSEPIPFWQSNLTGKYRQVPDVAFDGDMFGSPISMYNADGTKASNGGTSLSSPLFVGAWARLQSAHNNQLGFAAPMIYASATPQKTLFGKLLNAEFALVLHDVQSGNNGGYVAGPGWDLATGWGSLDVGNFNTFLNLNPWIMQTGNQMPPVLAPWK